MRQWKGRSLPDSSQPDSNSYGQTTCCFFRCSLPYFHFRKNSVVLFSSHGIKNWFLLWDLTVGFHDEWPIIPWLLNGIMWDYVGFSHIFPYFMVVFESSVAATVALQHRCRWALPPRISTGWKHETSRCPKTHAWRRSMRPCQKTGKGSSSGPSGWDSLVNSGEFWRVEITFSMGKDRWWIFDEHSLTLIKYDVAISLISEYLVS